MQSTHKYCSDTEVLTDENLPMANFDKHFQNFLTALLPEQGMVKRSWDDLK
jgi:hypothetical protein